MKEISINLRGYALVAGFVEDLLEDNPRNPKMAKKAVDAFEGYFEQREKAKYAPLIQVLRDRINCAEAIVK
jgi:hypothetical protein